MKHESRLIKIRIVSGTAVLLLMGVIFLFSAGNGESSSGLSRTVTEWLIVRICPGYGAMSAAEQAGAFGLLHLIVRKAAHFSEYALLGAALRTFLWTFPLRLPGLWALLSAALYAALDEWHQTFVSGRSGQPGDVLIDSAGALCGVFLAAAVASLILDGRKRKKRPPETPQE